MGVGHRIVMNTYSHNSQAALSCLVLLTSFTITSVAKDCLGPDSEPATSSHNNPKADPRTKVAPSYFNRALKIVLLQSTTVDRSINS